MAHRFRRRRVCRGHHPDLPHPPLSYPILNSLTDQHRLNASLLINYPSGDAGLSWAVNVLDFAVVPGERKVEFIVCYQNEKSLKRATSTKVEMETYYKVGGVIGEGVNVEVYQGWDGATHEPAACLDSSLYLEMDLMTTMKVLFRKSWSFQMKNGDMLATMRMI